MNNSAHQTPAAEPFCLLADPAGYVACSWDLTREPEGRQYWVEFFKQHLNTILELGVAVESRRGADPTAVARRAEQCREEFNHEFDRYAADPPAFGRVTILTLDQWRDRLLRRHGFIDPFIDLKDRENERMLPLLPELCRQLDSLDPPQQFRAIIEGVFAGNIFDLGAKETAKTFLADSPDFFAVRKTLPARPWLIDQYDRLAARMLKGPPHRKAVFFIDNAGSDFLLGALPMIRRMAKNGTHIVLAANERPTLNDMTIHDVDRWWPRILDAEPSFAGLPIERVTTGTGEPLIDLSEISPQLNSAADGADLVIIEGMGRGVESNLDARFTCDALNLAMIKDTMVAKRVGGKLFDVVCRFRGPQE